MNDNSTTWDFFRTALLEWYRPELRPMPWKEEKNPYLIWLSEIILQQTRVAQGLGYFERFRTQYPTVNDLAAAPDQEVMKLWEGLGYYSRARNLLKAARLVVKEFDGKFPDNYQALLQLPGVGPYTAAAIASFAYNEPVAVLDGNVYRILSRFTGNSTPIDTTEGKRLFSSYADSALAGSQAARYNQAIMDFGALICTPKAAKCNICPLRTACQALLLDQVGLLPAKAKKLKKRTRYFHYLVLQNEAGASLIHQRTEKDIWQDLFEFPLVESASNEVLTSQLFHEPSWPSWLSPGALQYQNSSAPRRQQLTHQTIIGQFHRFVLTGSPNLPAGYIWAPSDAFPQYAFPRLITSYLAEKTLYLDLF